MKKLNHFLTSLIILTVTVSSGFAQLPTYELCVKNMELVSYLDVDDAVEFDICLKNTTSPAADIEYAIGQFYFYFNQAIANSVECTSGNNCAPGIFSINCDLEYSIIPNTSGLPTALQPRNPKVGYPTMCDLNTLCLAFNATPGAGFGLIIPANTEVRIERMRLRKKSGTFNLQHLNLEWKNSLPLHFTKIFVYVGTSNTDITTPLTHTVDTSGLGGVLPVELANFRSSVDRNNVTLNWSTTTETNNSGFDIERKPAASNEWIKVTNIAGNGTAGEAKSYTFSERLNSGKYNYRLKQVDFNGNFKYYSLSNEIEVGVPDKYSISQNYPNPFNPATKIDFDLPNEGKVSIILYDITGREISKLVNEVKTAGYYSLQFNASNLASGMYFYRIVSGNFVASKKMMVLK